LEQVASFVENMVDDYAELLYVISQDPSVNNAFTQYGTLSVEEEARLLHILHLLLAGKRIRPALHVISETGAPILSTQSLRAELDPVHYGNWGLLRLARESAGKPVIYASGIRNRIGLNEIAAIGKFVSNPGAQGYFIILDIEREHIEGIINSLASGRTIGIDITDHQLIPFYTAGNEIPPNRFDVFSRINFYSETIAKTYYIGGHPYILARHKSNALEMYFFGFQVLSDALIGTFLGQRILFFVGLGTAFLCLFLAVLFSKNISDNMHNRITVLSENNKNKERSLRLAELRALQAQIHPHFIFNCLDLIKWNAKMGEGKEVYSIVLELGRLLRSSIRNTNEIVPLEDEFQIIRYYLSIQRRRFDDRFKFDIFTDPAILKILIPKFILQPIVENSLVHGLEEKTGSGHLYIRASGTGDYLEYEIRDDGLGIPKEVLAKILTGDVSEDQIGLVNVRRRLRLYYGNDFSFEIESGESTGTRVYIRHPVLIQEPV